MTSKLIKGFNEYVGPEAAKRAAVRKVIQKEFEKFGFEYAETPIIENEDFIAPNGNNDEAVRDIFRLKDRGKRKLALRFEFTFQLKRLAKNQKLPFKRFQIGQVFRDEPIRQGRSREFTQCDADIIGSSIKNEAESLSLVKSIFDKLDMPVKIYINSRRLINEILVDEKVEERYRNQVIREIDKLDKKSKKEVADELKKIGYERVLEKFTGTDFSKYKFYSDIKELEKYCKMFGVEVEFRPFLARGLSYYNENVFEVWSEKLNVSLCGGGAYLVNNIQAFGFALGFEPICLLTKIKGEVSEFLVISLDEDKIAITVAEKLRNINKKTTLLLDKTIGKGLEYANTKNINNVIIIGKNEATNKQVKIKNMKSGQENTINIDDLTTVYNAKKIN